ncbi:Rps23 Pro-64 3,4-dihydroxylase Tpa1-like proline 4-hydroxylase [Novosphingobium sp. PhB165]|uniref:2OG-Fe(II) oxygenase n=1 Tax=Novosphingobium sp. PhB165 TaxID=2485105 RepID=UPI00104F136D|nr:2OG-Fe(II) oxygenase [Novosphingobium sp. PhB165]TCM20819.1 Rps23 Pro-64 3,4-dihydroxylase Tpa1-like proline 4-hydroxylase [Novosphingobium sp. PhB165]
MAYLEMTDLGGYQCFDHEACKAAGADKAAEYRFNDPFPHVVVDDFLDPDLLRRVAAEFPDSTGHDYFDRSQERLKFQFRPDQCEGPASRILFAELNSRAFLTFLTQMTGIRGLIPDPYHAGAGLHETRRGGHLGVHADFPFHAGMKVERRLNLLIYLNEDWAPEYGGALELWDRGMQQARHSVLPEFGRAVIFSTDRDTFHGHPEPLTCPEGRSRRSIATYYYTAMGEDPRGIERSTDFRVRPGTGDKTDWRMRLQNLKSDWMPPILQRRHRQPLEPVPMPVPNEAEAPVGPAAASPAR